MASVRTVMVVGASGAIGPDVVSALLASPHNFSVSVLTRQDSKATFPTSVQVVRTDYTAASLLSALQGIDAVVSCIAATSADLQTGLIDAAVEAGVKRFIPSEYGVDTSLPSITDVLPQLAEKVRTVQYLQTKQKESGLTWSAVIVGSFFDWAFQYPGLLGWNLPARKATIFDGGDVEFEATNVEQIGRAVAALLAPENLADSANRYVFVNSFTTTQNQVLAALEKATGAKFDITHAKTAELATSALQQLKTGVFDRPGPDARRNAVVAVITSAIYNRGNTNAYSRLRHGDGTEPGVWNQRLGLPVETLEESVAKVVAKQT